MECCCTCIPSDPIHRDDKGRIEFYQREHEFQVKMMNAPFQDCSSFTWFCSQFIPCCCGLSQYFLRRKVLDGDMSQYRCCQGYVHCCGFGETECPDLCLCFEAWLCNGFAVSASRLVIMDRFHLSSDPCDYRLIRISNALQLLSCICYCLSICFEDLSEVARCIDVIADCFYFMVAGCITAQVAYEVDYQRTLLH